MIKKMIKEDTIQQAIKDAESPEEKKDIEQAGVVLDEPLVSDDEGQIEKALNHALSLNLRAHRNNDRNFSNLLFVGEAGSGKTARINSWARAKGINLVTVKAGELDDTDTGGVIAGNIANQVAVRLASTEFDQLGEANSVLFLDEWNRAPSTVRQALLTLIQNHTVTDPRVKGRMRYIPNFLFTVAAINPDDPDYDVNTLDQAELGRVRRMYVDSNVSNWAKYMRDYYTQLANRTKDEEDRAAYNRIVGLSSAIAQIDDFSFDNAASRMEAKSNESWNGLLLTPRTLTNAIVDAEGKKDVFLSIYNDYCNNLYRDILSIGLSKYKDIDDKANSALKNRRSGDPMFKSQKELDIDTINDLQNSINSGNIF